MNALRGNRVTYLDEAQVEIATVGYFREWGYEYACGPKIAPDGEAAERAGFGTRGADEPHTAFPTLLLRPLGHLSAPPQ